jgi:hypothetical protein
VRRQEVPGPERTDAFVEDVANTESNAEHPYASRKPRMGDDGS